MYNREDFNIEDTALLENAVKTGSEELKRLLEAQLLSLCLFSADDEKRIVNLYENIFNISSGRVVTIALFSPDTEAGKKRLIKYYSGMRGVYIFYTSQTEKVVALICQDADDDAGIEKCLDGGDDISVVYEKDVAVEDLKREYRLLRERSDGLFYTDNAGMWQKNEIGMSGARRQISPPYAEIESAVGNGDLKKAHLLLDSAFEEIKRNAPPINIARNICLGLYMCIVRSGGENPAGRYFSDIAMIGNAARLLSIKKLLSARVAEIAKSNTPKNNKMYSSLINETVSIIEDNLGNENLSLRWIAGTVLYTNVDYLGKLFKKETGKNFSHYVMEKRMEMAKELIVDGKKDKIYEVAEKVGYGSNSQYFSQVFKKYTGVSPLEYKEFVRVSARSGI